MYSTLPEFQQDIGRIDALLDTIKALKEFAGYSSFSEKTIDDDFVKNAENLHGYAAKNHAYIVFLSGTLVLFLAGRFEAFVRNSFEELCINVSSEATYFHDLPKEMCENLITFTAEVASSPRKYGHGEQGVKAFIKTLAENLTDGNKLSNINHSCLSITNENMRPQILADLFKRIGVKNIWDTIGEQAKLKVFFEAHDSKESRSKAEKYLNEFMETRNKIAHPSASFNWPEIDKVKNYVEFLKILSTVLIDTIEVYEIELKNRVKSKKEPTRG